LVGFIFYFRVRLGGVRFGIDRRFSFNLGREFESVTGGVWVIAQKRPGCESSAATFAGQPKPFV